MRNVIFGWNLSLNRHKTHHVRVGRALQRKLANLHVLELSPGKLGRQVARCSPALARGRFSSALFSPVVASPRWASSTGTDLFL
ncbi:hypothetical protein A2U01_0049302 [Trifolium medium]|uniref:Uncharacterized protein n=1 Tax=Trifolium medium TaxID=97028 RepID=A0A392QW30_9FABA|nr:hypothetical protein [Trifolium medium]